MLTKKEETYSNIPIRTEKKRDTPKCITMLRGKKYNYLQQNTNIIYGKKKKQACLKILNCQTFGGKTSAHAPTIWS